MEISRFTTHNIFIKLPILENITFSISLDIVKYFRNNPKKIFNLSLFTYS